MKIERISENQIRCTLSKEDLVDRQLRLSELAYGTEKAKSLFRDMMQQAACELGFEADDIPLMIEAIPISSECLVLVVTKVEDPDELDTRFSKFSPIHDSSEDDNENDDASYADEILNCFSQLDNLLDNTESNNTENKSANDDFVPLPDTLTNTDASHKKESEQILREKTLTKVFIFNNLDEVIELADLLKNQYNGINTLYKDTASKQYYLVIQKSNHSPEEFNKYCNIITEYGKAQRTSYAAPSYYEEHFEIITKNKALQILATI